MRQIPERAVANWLHAGGNSYLPHVIDTSCPACERVASFTADKAWTSLGGDDHFAASHCPACGHRVKFFVMSKGTGPNSLAGGSLFVYPASKSVVPSAAILDCADLPDNLKDEYRSAVECLGLKQWIPTAVLCRRLLEGIAMHALPPAHHSKTLAVQLVELPNHVNLQRPILDLADAVRKGGNFAAHFDGTRKPTQEVASAMLELVEDLLKYLFTLPIRITELRAQLDPPPPPSPGATAAAPPSP